MRVCDPCFDLYGPKEEAGARPPAQQQKKKTEGDLPAEYLASALSKQVCTLIIYEKTEKYFLVNGCKKSGMLSFAPYIKIG